MYSNRDRYKRQRQLRQAGIDPEPGHVEMHNSDETDLHAVVKLLVCREIHQRGRPFATEVELPDGGVVDVLDYGLPDGYAVVYEVESEPTPSRTREKVEQYTQPWIIRDVLILDLRDAPTELAALSEWISERVVG